MEIRTPQPSQATDNNRLTSERLKNFQEVLEILYIKDNLGGRIHFMQDWPEAALYIFGDDLCRCDREGTKDRESRRALEDMAEDRRVAFLDFVSNLEEKSIKNGVLQMEFVKGTIENLGRGLSLYLYAPPIVDRFIPPPPVETPAGESVPLSANPEPEAVPVVMSVADPKSIDIDNAMDSIKPIDVGPVAAPVVSEPTKKETSGPDIKIFSIPQEKSEEKPTDVSE